MRSAVFFSTFPAPAEWAGIERWTADKGGAAKVAIEGGIAEVVRRYRRGDRPSARALFERLLPILGWQNQHIDISNQFLKLLAVRQGTFAAASVRRPPT